MHLRTLSIGADYRAPHGLRFAVSDAVAVDAAFRTQRFYDNVEAELFAPARDAGIIREKLVKMAATSAPTDCLILFFAGHGLVEEDPDGKDQFYLVCDATDPEQAETTALRVDDVVRVLEQSRASIAVALLDCCFSGYGGRSILGRKTLAKLRSGRVVSKEPPMMRGFGRVVISAAGRGEQALEDDSTGHGFFTEALLRVLRSRAKSSITIATLYARVQESVRDRTLAKQCPSLYGGDHGASLPTVFTAVGA